MQEFYEDQGLPSKWYEVDFEAVMMAIIHQLRTHTIPSATSKEGVLATITTELSQPI